MLLERLVETGAVGVIISALVVAQWLGSTSRKAKTICVSVASSYAAKHAAIASVTSIASSVAAEHASIAAAAKPIGISLFGLHGPVSRVGEGYASNRAAVLIQPL